MKFRTPLLWSAPAVATLFSVATAQALVITNGTGTTPPAALTSQFAHIGQIGGSTGIYLGNGYALVPSHVVFPGAGTQFNIPGSGTYTSDGNVTAIRDLSDPTKTADLYVFHLSTTPAGLSTLTIPASEAGITNNAALNLIGSGKSNAPDGLRYYSVTNSPSGTTGPTYDPSQTSTWTQLAGVAGSNAAGYGWGDDSTKVVRYGSSTVVATGSPASPFTDTTGVGGTGATREFTFLYNNVPGSAGVADKDSGSGVFDSSGNLIGVINAIATFRNQPAATTDFGNVGFAISLPAYRDQILAATVPEPASMGVIALGALTLLRRRRA